MTQSYTLQQPLPLNGGFFYSPAKAASIIGLEDSCIFRWAARSLTSYDFPISVTEHQRRRLIEERDVRILAQVQRAFPISRGGPGPRRRREQMQEYAFRLRAALAAR